MKELSTINHSCLELSFFTGEELLAYRTRRILAGLPDKSNKELPYLKNQYSHSELPVFWIEYCWIRGELVRA